MKRLKRFGGNLSGWCSRDRYFMGAAEFPGLGIGRSVFTAVNYQTRPIMSFHGACTALKSIIAAIRLESGRQHVASAMRFLPAVIFLACACAVPISANGLRTGQVSLCGQDTGRRESYGRSTDPCADTITTRVARKAIALRRIRWQDSERFTTLWESAVEEARREFPHNKKLHEFLALPWTTKPFRG